MASTNKTTNLGLPQWEAGDPVERADFNDSFSKIDVCLGRRKIFDFAVTGKAKILQLDFSGINLDEFYELEFYFQIKDDLGNELFMRINEYKEQNYLKCAAGLSSSSTYNRIALIPATSHLILGKNKYYIGSEMNYWRFEIARSFIPRIETVEFYYSDGTTLFDPGERVTVWGVKR